MEQHPIPQNISAYKFHLVGDMTLKQFGELGVGLLLAWLSFSSGLNFVFKWTLGPFFAFLGFALAFLPVEDRPLDQWIINFFKSIYRPTQFVYQSESKPIDIFDYHTSVSSAPNHQTQTPLQINDYLESLPPTPATPFDIAEKNYLNNIRDLFGALGSDLPQDVFTEKDSSLKIVPNQSHHGLKIRKLKPIKSCLLPQIPPKEKKVKTAGMPLTAKPSPAIPATEASTRVSSAVSTDPLPRVSSAESTDPLSRVSSAESRDRDRDRDRDQDQDRNQNQTTTTSKKSPLTQTQPTPKPKVSTLPEFHAVNPRPKAGTTSTKPAAFVDPKIMPFAPQSPNLISGLTLNSKDAIIPNVIIEIKDSSDQSVRALKSNKLGQFFIATPLLDGIYKIQAEHQDHHFDIIKIEAKNEIIPPIKIQSSD